MFGKLKLGLTAAFGLAAGHAHAEEAYLRVVDVGNALCVVAKVPGQNYMLYDAGNFNSRECIEAVQEIVDDKNIDLIVLSHSDADHVGELPVILSPENGITVEKLIYTGRPGTSVKTWPKVIETMERIEKEARPRRNPIRNLQLEPLPNVNNPDKSPLTIKLGDALVTFVAGWYNWPYSDEPGAPLSKSERNNVVSIVAKFTYAGKSVLLTGDTIGRIGGDPDNACRYAEKWMIEKGNVSLKSDVLIGQHHGGDNSSASCFIKAVNPDYVVLGSGHVDGHDHPRQTTAKRFLDTGLSSENIFRTDLNDDQGIKEWDYGRHDGCSDQRGDDDVEIIISDDPKIPVHVKYRGTSEPCP